MQDDYLSVALGAAAERLLELRLVKPIKIANPAPGADWTTTVPGGVVWELLSITGLLTASATVANRNPSWRISDQDNNLIFRYASGGQITATQGGTYTSSVGLGNVITTQGIQAPLPSPPIPILAGWKIAVITSGIDATDQWSGVFLVVREWSESDVVRTAMDIDAQLTALTEREVTGR